MSGLAQFCARARAQGRAGRLLVLEARGSAPREPGAWMQVWEGGEEGSIGGGRLEHEALIALRRAMISPGAAQLDRYALGPALGQCCGGSVTLLSEVLDADGAERLLARGADGIWARPVAPHASATPPAAIRHYGSLPAAARPPMLFKGGWLAEALSPACRELWVHGAGHVGLALARMLAPLPDYRVRLVDARPARQALAAGEGLAVDRRPAAQVIAAAGPDAIHYVMTHDHATDLELCHRILLGEFAFAGLIGSASKWARFRKRLSQLGHAPERIDRITCPIGRPELGKHPQAIALGVAQALLLHPPAHAGKETAA